MAAFLACAISIGFAATAFGAEPLETGKENTESLSVSEEEVSDLPELLQVEPRVNKYITGKVFSHSQYEHFEGDSNFLNEEVYLTVAALSGNVQSVDIQIRPRRGRETTYYNYYVGEKLGPYRIAAAVG